MSAITKGTKFPAELEREMFNLVKGKSSVAAMAAAEPIPFKGKDIFTFSFDDDVSIVGEGANKPAGGATVAPVQIRPIKVVYQSRVNEEFMYAAEEERMDTLRDFSEGFARKMAAAVDIMTMHGKDPKTGLASQIIGNNHLDYLVPHYKTGVNAIAFNPASDDPVAKLNAAIDKIDDPNGIILGGTIRGKIAALTTASGGKQPVYPEFNFGGYPDRLGNCKLDVNKTVEAKSSGVYAYVGDWATFRWGYAKELPLEVIEYGDPDGAGVDLKRANQVLLRSEAFVGWGFLDPAAFALVGSPTGATGATGATA